jgi:hypothetical protein
MAVTMVMVVSLPSYSYLILEQLHMASGHVNRHSTFIDFYRTQCES